MKPVKRYPLRKIAENELTRCFDDLDSAVTNDLAISLVRQWLTNDGYAGLVTPTHECWFHMVPKEVSSVDVGLRKKKQNWSRHLTRRWQVDEEEIPELLHRLNLCQSVLCRTTDGRTIRLWMEPKEEIVRCEEYEGEEE